MFRKKERSNGNEKERFSERFSERLNLVKHQLLTVKERLYMPKKS